MLAEAALLLRTVCPPSFGNDGHVGVTLAHPPSLASLIFASALLFVSRQPMFASALCVGLRGLFKHTSAAAVSSAHLDVNRSQ